MWLLSGEGKGAWVGQRSGWDGRHQPTPRSRRRDARGVAPELLEEKVNRMVSANGNKSIPSLSDAVDVVFCKRLPVSGSPEWRMKCR